MARQIDPNALTEALVDIQAEAISARIIATVALEYGILQSADRKSAITGLTSAILSAADLVKFDVNPNDPANIATGKLVREKLASYCKRLPFALG